MYKIINNNKLLNKIESNSKIELLALKSGLKPVSRHIIPKHYLEEVESFAKKHRLNIKTIQREKGLFIYISNDEEKVNSALKIETELINFQHRFCSYHDSVFTVLQENLEQYSKLEYKLGKLFGFPDCCIFNFINQMKNVFIKYNKGEIPKITLPNFVKNSYLNSKRFPFQTNVFVKEKKIIFHIPCCFECEHSLEYANKIIDFIETNDENLAEEIKQNLKKSFIVWDEDKYLVLNDNNLNKIDENAFVVCFE